MCSVQVSCFHDEGTKAHVPISLEQALDPIFIQLDEAFFCAQVDYYGKTLKNKHLSFLKDMNTLGGFVTRHLQILLVNEYSHRRDSVT